MILICCPFCPLDFVCLSFVVHKGWGFISLIALGFRSLEKTCVGGYCDATLVTFCLVIYCYGLLFGLCPLAGLFLLIFILLYYFKLGFQVPYKTCLSNKKHRTQTSLKILMLDKNIGTQFTLVNAITR